MYVVCKNQIIESSNILRVNSYQTIRFLRILKAQKSACLSLMCKVTQSSWNHTQKTDILFLYMLEPKVAFDWQAPADADTADPRPSPRTPRTELRAWWISSWLIYKARELTARLNWGCEHLGRCLHNPVLCNLKFLVVGAPKRLISLCIWHL